MCKRNYCLTQKLSNTPQLEILRDMTLKSENNISNPYLINGKSKQRFYDIVGFYKIILNHLTKQLLLCS